MEEQVTIPAGAFVESLYRGNKEIKKDRAEAIAEDVQTVYKRKVEDMELEMKRLIRKRENMLDMAPDNAHSLKPASDVNAVNFVEEDLRIGYDLKQLELRLEVARARYKYLFTAGAPA